MLPTRLLLIILALWPSLATGQEAVRVLLPADVPAAELKPADRHVVVIGRVGARPRPDEDKVVVVDSLGRTRFKRAPGLDVPNAQMVAVNDADVVGHRLVVAVFARSVQREEASLLLYYDLDRGVLTRTVRTSPIACKKVALESGGMWCLGLDVGRFNKRQAFPLLYHFNGDGVLSQAILDRTAVPKKPNPWLPAKWDFARIDCSRAGKCYAWLAASQTLVQWSVDGRDLTVRGETAHQVAALEDGKRVYALTVLPSGQPGRANTHQLRLTNVTAHRTLDGRASLVGVDNGRAVFWNRVEGTVTWSDYQE